MEPLLNPARIDFVSLRLFCAVAQSGSINKGAEMCNLVPSAASRRLADMESAFGTRLLQRSAQGVVLTPAGHVALQHSMRLFHGLEHFTSELRDYARGVKGHVRLWANMSALSEFLPPLLSAFLSEHSDIKVDVEEQLSGDIVRALADGVADIGVFAQGTPTGTLEVAEFHRDELVLICMRPHPLANVPRVRFAECLDFDFVGLNQGSSLLELALREAERAGHELKIRVQVRSFDAMCHMIAAGLGVGVVPLRACTGQIAALGLAAIPIEDPWAVRQLLLASRDPRLLSPPAQMLRDHLLAAAPSAQTRI